MKKIIAARMKPGMLINTGSKRNPHFQLVTAKIGVVSVEYTFFDLLDPYWGPCSTTIDGKTKIRVYKGETKMNAIKIVRDAAYERLQDVEAHVDTINLIQSMTEENL